MPGTSREPVLKQIRLPHAYYYREMYVPQVTSGPTSATWSPDGQELIYSMQGSLWRQRIGSIEATQVTSGDGYDYQPDWSPDGRHVVYATYRNDAVELWLLDLTRGDARPIVAQGAVNVDPRWSPDGSRLAFVSTSHEGRWHVFVAPIDDGRIGTPVRVTEDHDSRLPRYYYSVWDHYLSPSWSPDGRELMLVSNRGRVWGTGGLWRMPAVPGTPPARFTTRKPRGRRGPTGRRTARGWSTAAISAGSGTSCGSCPPVAATPSSSRTATSMPLRRAGHMTVRALPSSRTRTATRRCGCSQSREDRALASRPASASIARRSGVFDCVCSMATAPRCRHASRCTTPRARSYAPDAAWRHADEAFVRSERRFEYRLFPRQRRVHAHAAGGSIHRRGFARAGVRHRTPRVARRA